MKKMKFHFTKGAFILLAWAILSSCSKTEEAKMSLELSNTIASDTRFETVSEGAENLIQSGLNAGDGYSEVWIRDLNTFIETACKVSDRSKLREALLVFFKFQAVSKDGNIVDGYTTKDHANSGGIFYYSDLAPAFAAHKNTVETDQETSLIQAIYKYITLTGDHAFLKEVVAGKTVEERMADAMNFLLKYRYSEKYGLIWGATTADWGDVQPEQSWGVLLDSSSHKCIDIYDNAMFLIAIKDYVKMLNDSKAKEFWNKKYEQIANNSKKYLWDKKNQKFIPHLYLNGSPFPANFDENAIYFQGGTAVAIEAGLLNKKEVLTSYQKMQANVKAAHAQTIGLTLYPVYPNGFFYNKIMTEYSYQNGGDWTWFGARMVQQLIAYGYYKEAYEAISPMLDRVIKHGGFYEWWTPDGKPSGSGAFRGSAGVLWKAIEMFKEKSCSNEVENTKPVNASKPLSNYVDPNIGTAHCRWFFYTPAASPFGMAKLGPSTNGHYGNASGWEAVGYDYRDQSIEGFACLHEFQVGGIVLAPSVGLLQTVPGDTAHPDQGYRSRFDKKDEYATTGYYSVLLKDYQVKVELTATKRVGFQRYTFPQSDQSHILFDIGNQQGESGKVKDAKVTMTADGRIEGYVSTIPEYVKVYQPKATVTMYFSAVLDKTPSAWGTFIKDKIKPNAKEVAGIGAGLYLTFNTKEKESITAKIGVSYTSIENARLNLNTEAKDLTFDQAHDATLSTWNNYLGRIKVEGPIEKDKVKFYTGLYHALLGRGLASDVNGAYPMNNGQIGHIALDDKGIPKHNHYNTDAIWGGFWNLTQLWSLAYPEYYADWIQSQLLVYKETGWLGDGIANSKYVSGVGTNFTGLAIAAAYNCGIRNFDINLAYEAALKNEIGWKNRLAGAGKMDVKAFVEKGFTPIIDQKWITNAGGSIFGASHTLEYSFSSYAVAQFAKSLGKEKDYNQLMKLSEGWKNLFDPETKLIRPKLANGKFISNFNPLEPWRGFQEGNAIQYTFYIPQHIDELVNLIGKDRFNSRLDSIFIVSEKNVFGGGTTVDAFSGLQAVYNHGNQPCLHISWLFNFSGKPALTQKWVRAICNEFYGTEGLHGYGYGQDEDQGQLGAWYVMSSIGLFDAKGLTEPNPSFEIGSCLFDKVTIRRPGAALPFVIQTKNNSKENIYIQAVSYNGKPIENYSIPFQEVINGGVLSVDLDKTIKP